MQNQNGWKPLTGLIILDTIGVLFHGVGLLARFMNIAVVPTSLRFEHYDLALMVLGGMLILPIVNCHLN
ncbi:MAG: chemotaxis protein [Phototrophicales bacterium]|nr:MAG: chemotaxis protein [Phototrophicales bacterium]